ncbi:TPA: hypothetical protein P2R04_001203 [Aeromonas veronii]|nr:hypothetical protein [Aeromonas veronii]
MTFQKLKYIRYISIFLLLIYAIHPFINGLGCSYHAQSENAQLSFYTTCKMGFVESVVKNKITGKLISFKGIYGKSGNTIFFITYQVNILSVDKSDLNNVTELYTSNRIFVSKLIKNSDGSEWVMLQHPYYTVHQSRHIGKLAFL